MLLTVNIMHGMNVRDVLFLTAHSFGDIRIAVKDEMKKMRIEANLALWKALSQHLS